MLFFHQVFTAAAADERKNIVLLAFETMEKIVREYFPYITETETLTFTDCVKCLLTFTNSRFNSDVSLNAIAFLRFCAVKLAEGGLVYNKRSEVNVSSIPNVNEDGSDVVTFNEKDEHASFWVPLLTGNMILKLTSEQVLQLLSIVHCGWHNYRQPALPLNLHLYPSRKCKSLFSPHLSL